jgi:peptide chain release factor subunit 1
LRGSASRLIEVRSFGDSVHGQHSQGGWSQARYQRSVEHDVEAHLRHVRDVLLRQFERRRFVGLLLAAPEELRSQVAGELHPYVQERLVGHLDLDVENATLEDVRSVAAKAIEEHQRAIVGERLEQLRARLGRGERTAAGAADVLRALEERRVGALLYDPQQLDEDVVERAVHAAVEQDAQVFPLDTPDLGPLGGIAALLRF